MSIQQPQPIKGQTQQQVEQRKMTESEPVSNVQYVQQQEAQKQIQQYQQNQGVQQTAKKKLQLKNVQPFQAPTDVVYDNTLSQSQPLDYQPNKYQQQQYQSQRSYPNQPYGIQHQNYQNKSYQQPYIQEIKTSNEPQPLPQQLPQQTQQAQQVTTTTQPKEKKKLKLVPKGQTIIEKLDKVESTPQIQTQPQESTEEKQMKEEEKQMKEEQERLRQLQEKKIQQKRPLQTILDFNQENEEQLDKLLKDNSILYLASRKLKTYKQQMDFKRNSYIQQKGSGQQGQKQPYSKDPKKNYTQYAKPDDKQQQDFKRGSQIIQAQSNMMANLTRPKEDISIKLKKEEIKKNLKWLEEQRNKEGQESVQMEKELKFKLNQLAPDNKDVVTEHIINIISKHQYLADKCAGLVMEKAWLEPRYRELYTEVCKKIVQDPRLMIEMETQANGGETKKKKRQIFKDAILNKVQTAFESDDIMNLSEEQLKQMSKQELEIQYIRRKNRILGNVRFIGDLFIYGVLPEVAIYLAQSQLLLKFITLTLDNKEISKLSHPEDQLEGLVELYDKAGEHLQKIQQSTKKKSAFDNESTILATIEKAIRDKNVQDNDIFEERVSLNGMFEVFRILSRELGLSTRIKILIQNLEERKIRGWEKHINQKNESAKTKEEIEREIEDQEDYNRSSYQGRDRDRDRGDRDRDRERDRGKKVQSNVQYQPKYQAKQEQIQEIQKQDSRSSTTKNDRQLEKLVDESFNVSCEEQLEILLDCLKEKDISENSDKQRIFWTRFFDRILDAKQQSLERASILYGLMEDESVISNIDAYSFQKGFQSKFKEDYIYDTMDSQLGKDLYSKIFLPFFEHSQYYLLVDYFKFDLNEEVLVEFKKYMGQVGSEILKKLPDQRPQLEEFFKSNLQFSSEEMDQI